MCTYNSNLVFKGTFVSLKIYLCLLNTFLKSETGEKQLKIKSVNFKLLFIHHLFYKLSTFLGLYFKFDFLKYLQCNLVIF